MTADENPFASKQSEKLEQRLAACHKQIAQYVQMYRDRKAAYRNSMLANVHLSIMISLQVKTGELPADSLVDMLTAAIAELAEDDYELPLSTTTDDVRESGIPETH